MCSNCGSRDPGRRYEVDGTGRLVCSSCAKDAIQISWAHEQIRRIHFAAHGYDSPCPICQADDWLIQQRVFEDLERSIARARLWP